MATPSLQLEFTIHILDLSTPEHRRTSKTLLDSQHKPTVHQLDRSDLSHEELLDILNAFEPLRFLFILMMGQPHIN